MSGRRGRRQSGWLSSPTIRRDLRAALQPILPGVLPDGVARLLDVT
jgi:hypothetical protein